MQCFPVFSFRDSTTSCNSSVHTSDSRENYIHHNYYYFIITILPGIIKILFIVLFPGTIINVI